MARLVAITLKSSTWTFKRGDPILPCVVKSVFVTHEGLHCRRCQQNTLEIDYQSVHAYRWRIAVVAGSVFHYLFFALNPPAIGGKQNEKINIVGRMVLGTDVGVATESASVNY